MELVENAVFVISPIDEYAKARVISGLGLLCLIACLLT